jgi:DNA modification methylase
MKSLKHLKIVLRKIADLIPLARNARTHSEQQVAQIAASIKEFGWTNPVLIGPDDIVIAGHARLLGAKKLGMDEVPVIVLDGLTAAQRKALVLADNRLALNAGWNSDLLRLELEDLQSFDFNLDVLGFDQHELDDLLRDPEDGRADEAPSLPDVAVTVSGDLWLCGKHRVLCGDATSAEDVARLLGERKPRLMATDPPYGVSYDPMWREDAGLGRQRQTGKVANDDQVDWTAAYKLFAGDVVYVWHAGVHAGEVAANLDAVGFDIRAQIIWSKQHFAMSRGHYHWGHEPCWYAVRKGGKANWCGDRTQSTIWQVPNLNPMGGDRNETATGHGTQKPVELSRRPIVNHTKRGDAIYDPFIGSGSTMMAAELTERLCCGIDVDPRYVDVAVMRWQEFTGKNATLDGDGRSFEQMRNQRIGISV